MWKMMKIAIDLFFKTSPSIAALETQVKQLTEATKENTRVNNRLHETIAEMLNHNDALNKHRKRNVGT